VNDRVSVRSVEPHILHGEIGQHSLGVDAAIRRDENLHGFS
jgi:hypothetical protein